MDRLKPFIANSMIQIEGKKGRDHRTVPTSRTSDLVTNHEDALPMTNDDERFV